jgi:hypothetical protein
MDINKEKKLEAINTDKSTQMHESNLIGKSKGRNNIINKRNSESEADKPDDNW